MLFLALVIAAGIGYAVTIGMKGHMAPAEGDAIDLGVPKTCLDTFDALPTTSPPGGDTDLRTAAKWAYAHGTAADAMAIGILADHFTAIGFPVQGKCLRDRGNILSRPLLAAPTTPADLKTIGTDPGSSPMAPTFPTGSGA